MPLYDAHNHLQDGRFAARIDEVLAACRHEGVARMVVNGTSEADWPAVLAFARKQPVVLPSFGCHPWHVRQRTSGWMANLQRHLDAVPSAIGEIGLDRWINEPDIPLQEEMFRVQLRLAAERNLPTTIHCLKAWGRLEVILQGEPRPQCGFLLHSYGGPAEMVANFARLGAYFSLSGYFAHERKARQRAVFKVVPRERLLLETDAPDMWPPARWNRYPLQDSAAGKVINHPANLGAVYCFAAELLGVDLAQFTATIAENFNRLFGLHPG